MKFGEFPFILFRFDKAKSDKSFEIKSSEKRVITNREYLSTSKGTGGHIVGFLRYDPHMELHHENVLGFTTILGALSAFYDKNHPDLIILNPSYIADLLWEGKLVESSASELDQIIYPSTDVIKFAELGRAMDVPNTAEIDFVGDIKIPAFVIHNVTPKRDYILSILNKIYENIYINRRPFNLNDNSLKQPISVIQEGGKKLKHRSHNSSTRNKNSGKRKTRRN